MEGKRQLYVAQNALANHTHVTQNALDWRHLIKLDVFSFTYSQMTAQQLRQLDVYCRHLYFMKIGHEINCCVFKSRECIITPLKALRKNAHAIYSDFSQLKKLQFSVDFFYSFHIFAQSIDCGYTLEPPARPVLLYKSGV